MADEAEGLDGQDDYDPPVVSFSSHFSNLRRRVTAQATVSGAAVMMIGSTKLACGPLLLLFLCSSSSLAVILSMKFTSEHAILPARHNKDEKKNREINAGGRNFAFLP